MDMELLMVWNTSLVFQGETINIFPQLSLLVADVLQAIGGILSVKWVYDGKVVTGSFCNAQGIPLCCLQVSADT